MIRIRRQGVVGLSLVAMAGCVSLSPDPHVCLEPDRRLAEALTALDPPAGGGRAPADPCGLGRNCGRVRGEVERLVAVCPAHAPSLLAAAALAFETGDVQSAQRRLDELAELTGRDPGATVLRARIAVKEGNLRYARRLVETEIKLAPASGALRETLAGVLYLQGELAGARAALAVAGRLGAPAWRVTYHLGLIDEAVGDHDAAARRYAEALDLNPDWLPARTRLEGLRAVRPAK